MSTETQPSALIKFGPILGPAAGVLIMAGLIAWVLFSGDVSEERNKLSTKNSEVTSLLSKADVSRPIVSSNPINLGPDLEREWERDAWEMSENENTAVDLPMLYGVITDGVIVKLFAKYDENNSKSWDESEFNESPYGTETGDKGKFSKWDRNNDGEISEEEFGTPPEDPEKLYNDKLALGNKELTKSEFPQLDEADRNQDGLVNLEEFVWWMGGGRVSFKKTSIVADVLAAVDANKMKVLISWTEPEIEDGFRPDDIEYIVYASSPEDRMKRDREFGIKSANYTADLAIWRDALKKWKSAAHETEAPKTNSDVYGRNAEKKYVEGNPKPDKPDAVSEWNEVARVTETQCEISFLLGSTYRYAVSVVTSSDLLKSNREMFIGKRNEKAPFETSMVEQTTAPVRMENRVAIEHNGKSGETGRVSLSTWIANANGDYYWVTITDDVSDDKPDLGGKYTLAALIKMKGTISGDKELAAEMNGIDPAQKFNFIPYANIPRGGDSGQALKFIMVSGSVFILNSRAHGDYVLSKSAKGPIRHSVGEGDTKVRCLNTGRNSSVFEITRWVEADGKWFLAVLTQKVTKGKPVGISLDLSSSNNGLKVYDEKGKLVTGPKIEIDLSVGKYGGTKGRDVALDGADFDIFGVMLK